jgi:hypothetical protein
VIRGGRRTVALTLLVAVLLACCGSAVAQPFGSASGPKTVHPGKMVSFHASGFLPRSHVRVTVQAGACLGSNGCAVGVRRQWKVNATGSVVVHFRFPRHYGICVGTECAEYRPFQKGKYAQVQICDQSSAEGVAESYVGCAVKMVRIGKG